MSAAKTTELADMLFAWADLWAQGTMDLMGGAHWCHIVNMIEQSVHGSGVALRQTTLTICFLLHLSCIFFQSFLSILIFLKMYLDILLSFWTRKFV